MPDASLGGFQASVRLEVVWACDRDPERSNPMPHKAIARRTIAIKRSKAAIRLTIMAFLRVLSRATLMPSVGLKVKRLFEGFLKSFPDTVDMHYVQQQEVAY